MLSAIAESGLTYHLTARSERPIQGCMLTPHVFLQLKGGNAGVDNSTRAKLLDSVPYQYVYKWRRSKVLSMCGNPGCSKGSSFDPAYWSRIHFQGPSLACAVCLNAGMLTHEALFCCSRYSNRLMNVNAYCVWCLTPASAVIFVLQQLFPKCLEGAFEITRVLCSGLQIQVEELFGCHPEGRRRVGGVWSAGRRRVDQCSSQQQQC